MPQIWAGLCCFVLRRSSCKIRAVYKIGSRHYTCLHAGTAGHMQALYAIEDIVNGWILQGRSLEIIRICIYIYYNIQFIIHQNKSKRLNGFMALSLHMLYNRKSDKQHRAWSWILVFVIGSDWFLLQGSQSPAVPLHFQICPQRNHRTELANWSSGKQRKPHWNSAYGGKGCKTYCKTM